MYFILKIKVDTENASILETQRIKDGSRLNCQRLSLPDTLSRILANPLINMPLHKLWTSEKIKDQI